MNEKITPGPWGIDPFVAQVNEIATGEPICQMLWPTNKRSEMETRANAELIAMVPELIQKVKLYSAQVAIWRHNLEVLLEELDNSDIDDIEEYIRGMLTVCPKNP